MKRSSKPSFWTVATPRNVNRVTPILKIKAADVRNVAICSPRVWGHATHWNGARTVPCTLKMGSCICQSGTVSTRDKGLVLVANGVGQLLGFLEVTPMAFEQLVMMSTNIDGLRGKLVSVRRQHQSLRGQLLVEEIGVYTGETPLPKDQDPEPTLRRIYGWEEQR